MANFIQTIKPKSGVYIIVNTSNDWVYVGSSKNIEKRKRQHFFELANNTHRNKHLQNSFNMDSKKFIFIVYEYTKEYKNLEQIIINNRFGNKCYNNSKTVFFPTMSKTGRDNLIASKIEMHRNKPWLKEKMRIARSCDRVKKIQSETAKKQRLNPEYTKNLTSILREKLKKFYDVVLIDDFGNEHHIGWNLREFCKIHKLDRGNINKILNKKAKSCKGWRLKNV